MPENQREKGLTYVYPLNCVTSQFSTLKLSEKSKVNKCQHCFKTFGKPSGLKAHLFSHTGEKPHKCPVANCERYFSLLSNLRRHMKIHNKGHTKNRVSTSKRSISKIRPLLPIGAASTKKHDSGNQINQGQQCQSSHETVPNQDHAYFQRESLTSVEFSSLPVTPMEDDDFVFANSGGNNYDKNLGASSSLLYDLPMSRLETSSLYLPSDNFMLPTTQANLEEADAQFPTPTLPLCPGGLEHPTWSAHITIEPQLSIDELNYLENINHQYLPPQQFFYSHDFFSEKSFYILK